MHELSVTQGILNIVIDQAKKHEVKKISKIRIKMGVLSDLLPESINYYFSIISKDSIAEGSVIEVEKLPLKVCCKDCGHVSEIDIKKFRCLSCSGQNLKIIQGNEFYIDSLEVE